MYINLECGDIAKLIISSISCFVGVMNNHTETSQFYTFQSVPFFSFFLPSHIGWDLQHNVCLFLALNILPLNTIAVGLL